MKRRILSTFLNSIIILSTLLMQVFTVVGVTPAYAAGTCFVNAAASGANDGTSWTDAYTSLQSAIADSCTEIWVAAGTYKPHASDRAISFNLETGVAIYGGFAGGETLLSQRDPATNVTILSGDLNGDDSGFTNNGENSYHVVVGSGTDNTAMLDGFTISGGNAPTGSGCPDRCGGGMYNDAGSPTVRNITFSGNNAYSGGGMMNYSGSNPTLTNVTFSGNSAGYGGGGISIMLSSSPTITNVIFSGNSAWDGGGMHSTGGGSPTLTNVTFSGNSASGTGGGINNWSSSPILKNVVIANSTSGGDCVNASGSLNASSSNNLIEDAANACGLTDGSNGNIIGADPLLGTLGNYGGTTQTVPLLPGSPAINAGTNTGCPTTDQRGVTRPQGAHCDIGAFEAVLHTVAFDSNGGSTVSSQTIVDGGKVTKPTNPTKIGYTFGGWYNGASAWDFDNDTVSATLTLTAHWTADLSSGLILHWTFEEGAGTVTQDQTVNNLDGSIAGSNGTRYSWSTDVPAGTGSNYSLRLLGGNSSNTWMQSVASSLLPSGKTSRTLCAWVKSEDGLVDGNADHIANYGQATTSNAFGMMIFTGNDWYSYGHRTGDFNTGIPASVDWRHHCVTYSGTTVTYYLDGVQVASGSRTLNTTPNTRFVVGARPDFAFDCYFDGWVDDVRLYNRVLSASEVAAVRGVAAHTVTFNANGGSGSMPSQTAVFPLALNANTFTHAGYTFAGWNTQPDGSGTSYANQQSYDFTADTTLYAQWTVMSYPTAYVAPTLTPITPLLPTDWEKGYFNGVWGSGVNDVYTVGYGQTASLDNVPLMYHSTDNGSNWTSITPNLPSGDWYMGFLNGAWGSGANDVYAVGYGGKSGPIWPSPLMYHSTDGGSNWSPITLNQPSNWTWTQKAELRAVWGSGANDVYTVGYGLDDNGLYRLPLMYHSTNGGSTWASITPDLPSGLQQEGDLFSVWGSGANDVYAVGYGRDSVSWNNLPLMYHSTDGGSSWTTITPSVPSGWLRGALNAVWGSGANDVYAVGYGQTATGKLLPLMYHSNDGGSSWAMSAPTVPSGWQQEVQFSGVWGSGVNDVYVVGYGLNGSLQTVPLLYHYDGSSWTYIIPALPSGWEQEGNLYGAWGSAGDNFYAVGYGLDNPNAQHRPMMYHGSIPDYTVTYNANGATGGTVPSDQTKTYGVDLILADNTDSLVKTGSTFNGWNTTSDGSGTHYAAGGTYTIHAALTLYAEWIALGTAPTVPTLVAPADKALVTTTPTLDWNDSSEVMALAVNPWSYEINITAPDGYNHTFNTASGLENSSLSDFSAAPLSPNTTYTWKVRAYNGTNQYSAWSLTRTFRTKLATPVLTLPADAATLNNTRPTFEWDEVPGATTYTLQILSGTKVVNTGTIKPPLHNYTPAKDLLPNTTYTWKVKANGTNAGDYSAPFTFATSAVNPPKLPVLTAPANAALLDVTLPQTLKWNPVAGVNTTSSLTTYPAAASFEVEYAADSSFTGSITTTVNGNTPAETQWEISGGTLSPNLTYYWRVRSWSGAGATGDHSAWSATRNFRTKVTVTTPLPAPTLNLPADNATQVSKRPTFEWDEVPGATSYTLQILSGTKVVNTGTIKPPLHAYTPAKDLLAGTTYTWQVKANGTVPSGFTTPPFTFTVVPNSPKVPALTLPAHTALVSSETEQVLKWNPVPSVNTTLPSTTYPAAASFEIEYAANSSFSGSTVETVNGDTQFTLPAGTLAPNLTYYWRVRSWSEVDAIGYSSTWSAARSLRTKLSAPVLNVPADGTTLNNKRPTFEWDEVPGATTYTLQVLKENPKTHLFTVVAHTGTIKAPAYVYTPKVDLLPSTTYVWKVKANGTNAGDYSAPFTFTTSANPPKTPIQSLPKTGTLIADTDDATLTWVAPLPVVNANPALAYPTAASYDVQVSTNPSFSNLTPNNNTKTLHLAETYVNLATVLATGTAPDNVIRPGRTYYWRVRSISDAGNLSSWSAARMIKVKFAAPTLVSPINGATGVGTRPTFSWDMSDNGLWTSVTITVANDAAFKTGVRTFTVNGPYTSYTIPNSLPALTDGLKYWKVKVNGFYTPITSAEVAPVNTFTP